MQIELEFAKIHRISRCLMHSCEWIDYDLAVQAGIIIIEKKTAHFPSEIEIRNEARVHSMMAFASGILTRKKPMTQ